MDRLPYAPAHRSGEPPTAYASRIAAAYGLSLRELCRDSRISRLDLVNGAPQAIAKLAILGGADPEDLSRHAFVRTDSDGFVHRGQVLRVDRMRAGRTCVCPQCLAQDVATAVGDPTLAFFCRAEWLIEAIDTCPIHNIGLVTVHEATNPVLRDDFSNDLADLHSRFADIATTAEPRKPTVLQDYVLDRLEGRPTDAPLLDAMDLSAAIRTCELLGVTASAGGAARREHLDAGAVRAAWDTGFAIARRGQQGIDELLGSVTAAYMKERASNDPAARLGFVTLNDYLRIAPKRPAWKHAAFEPLRIAVRTFIKNNFALKPGSDLLGEFVPDTTVHTLATLSKEVGAGTDRIRKLLVHAGVIGSDAKVNVVFDAREGRDAVGAHLDGLPLRDAAKYLGVHRILPRRLVEAKLLEPVVASSSDVRGTIAIEALDALVAKLALGAETVQRKRSGQVTLMEASRKANCRQIDVILLVTEGRLASTGRLAGARGFRCVLFDLSEVLAALHDGEGRTLSGRDFAKLVGIKRDCVRAMLDLELISTTTSRRAGHRLTRIPYSEVDVFRKRYVDLGEIARTLGMHHTTAKKALDAKGIAPVLPKTGSAVIVYLRADFAKHRAAIHRRRS